MNDLRGYLISLGRNTVNYEFEFELMYKNWDLNHICHIVKNVNWVTEEWHKGNVFISVDSVLYFLGQNHEKVIIHSEI